MLNEIETKYFKEALSAYLVKYNAVRELRILQIAEMSFDYSSSDFGIDYFGLYFRIDPLEYVEYADDVSQIQDNLFNASKLFLRSENDTALSHVVVGPKLNGPIFKSIISSTDKERSVVILNEIKSILISVSTGGPRIQEKNDEYIEKIQEIAEILKRIGIENIGLFKDLWEWYGVWSSGEYPSYQSRRIFISELISKILDNIQKLKTEELQSVEASGIQRLDRTIREIKYRFSEAKNEEQFQVLGVLCRDSLITLAQVGYVPEKHRQFCDIEPSKTDAKRMLEAIIQSELVGSTNETLRRYAKAANDLANELTHKRTATKRETVICINATFSIINILLALIDMIDKTSI